jgi:hypothetical protein
MTASMQPEARHLPIGLKTNLDRVETKLDTMETSDHNTKNLVNSTASSNIQCFLFFFSVFFFFFFFFPGQTLESRSSRPPF